MKPHIPPISHNLVRMGERIYHKYHVAFADDLGCYPFGGSSGSVLESLPRGESEACVVLLHNVGQNPRFFFPLDKQDIHGEADERTGLGIESSLGLMEISSIVYKGITTG